MPWPALELAEQELAPNRNAVAPVQSDRADREDTSNGRIRPQANQVNRNTPENGDPDRPQRRARVGIDLDPDIREGQQAVPREGKNGATEGLHGRERDELDNDETGNGKEDSTSFAQAVVEDHRHGLEHSVSQLEDFTGIAHAEAKHDVEHETRQIGKKHGHGDGPGGF